MAPARSWISRVSGFGVSIGLCRNCGYGISHTMQSDKLAMQLSLPLSATSACDSYVYAMRSRSYIERYVVDIFGRAISSQVITLLVISDVSLLKRSPNLRNEVISSYIKKSCAAHHLRELQHTQYIHPSSAPNRAPCFPSRPFQRRLSA
jgi:hypothetical protein